MFSAEVPEAPIISSEQICDPVFVRSYLARLGIPEINISELKVPSSPSTEDTILGEGSFAKVVLYNLVVPLEVLAYGHSESDPDVEVRYTYRKPLVVFIDVEVVVKKIESRHMFPELPMVQFFNELSILHNASVLEQSDSRTFSDPYCLRHPNSISCYGYVFDDADSHTNETVRKKKLWIVMERAKGSLSLEIIRTMTLAQRVGLSLAIVENINAFHRKGIVHGDLKPANVLELADGSFSLSDFGCSFSVDQLFFVLESDAYNSIKRRGCLDQYTPAIVKVSENAFKFIVHNASLFSDQESTEEDDLTEMDCPNELMSCVHKIFNQQAAVCNRARPVSLLISWDHPVMRFLEGQGFLGSFFEQMLIEHQCLGSPLHMAPELCRKLYPDHTQPANYGKRPDKYSDMYSLGIVLYEIFTGEEPYRDETSGGSVGTLVRKIIEGLRPIITSLYCEEDLVDIRNLESNPKGLALKDLIEAAWDDDPYKRPPAIVFINFFREWLYDIVVDLFIRNQANALENLLRTISNPSYFLFSPRVFQDQPERTACKMSLVQYALWALSSCSKVVLWYTPDAQKQAEKATLLKSAWVRENGKNSECMVERLLSAYNNFEKSTTQNDVDQIRKSWDNMGREQRRLPTPLFLGYRELQEDNKNNQRVVQEGDPKLENVQETIKIWHTKPQAVMSSTSITFFYEACHYNEKTLCRTKIAHSDENPQFPGFDLERERNAIKKLHIEVQRCRNLYT